MERCFLSCLFILMVCGASAFLPAMPAYAQSNAQQPNSEQRDSLDEIPDEYLIEANDYYVECANNFTMQQYYNCECLSLAFLDKRIEVGPSVHASSLKFALRTECRDAINAAGPVYEDCLRAAYRFKRSVDPEKFCECVANTYVEAMNSAAPEINSRNIVSYQTFAHARCRDPNLPVPGSQ